jgi:hypothetical protein
VIWFPTTSRRLCKHPYPKSGGDLGEKSPNYMLKIPQISLQKHVYLGENLGYCLHLYLKS